MSQSRNLEAAMSIDHDFLEKLRSLTEDQQRDVLELVESLKKKNGVKARRSLRGLWKNFKIDLTEQDISSARHEMWGTFPRDVS
jgi:hypothetical protein